jgi:hypothetical protein
VTKKHYERWAANVRFWPIADLRPGPKVPPCVGPIYRLPVRGETLERRFVLRKDGLGVLVGHQKQLTGGVELSCEVGVNLRSGVRRVLGDVTLAGLVAARNVEADIAVASRAERHRANLYAVTKQPVEHIGVCSRVQDHGSLGVSWEDEAGGMHSLISCGKSHDIGPLPEDPFHGP